MRGDKVADGRFQLGDTPVDAAAELLVGEFGKPPLHEIEPRPVGRGEMDMEAQGRTSSE